ncbi:hypothetical protein PPL_09964 [Heterostelium album PN500]|uniref:Uncharacterized protein n=1 Tax=Heterostelium pallidum (strain ATCC 26659 / Pp 5 / PN500) TaxID=670386 RepID=D3BPS0_HETP5|nr:hypothetical protein PPL_09964 [Heterostelium album PN500]EFA76598.1 hypothetical protein PPL_09964 [Heterostelium album PN500]|eukprot:XP_020428730.1 hypothetical protein PPL_09964 [Heterostelium album PN500]
MPKDKLQSKEERDKDNSRPEADKIQQQVKFELDNNISQHLLVIQTPTFTDDWYSEKLIPDPSQNVKDYYDMKKTIIREYSIKKTPGNVNLYSLDPTNNNNIQPLDVRAYIHPTPLDIYYTVLTPSLSFNQTTQQANISNLPSQLSSSHTTAPPAPAIAYSKRLLLIYSKHSIPAASDFELILNSLNDIKLSLTPKKKSVAFSDMTQAKWESIIDFTGIDFKEEVIRVSPDKLQQEAIEPFARNPNLNEVDQMEPALQWLKTNIPLPASLEYKDVHDRKNLFFLSKHLSFLPFGLKGTPDFVVAPQGIKHFLTQLYLLVLISKTLIGFDFKDQVQLSQKRLTYLVVNFEQILQMINSSDLKSKSDIDFLELLVYENQFKFNRIKKNNKSYKINSIVCFSQQNVGPFYGKIKSITYQINKVKIEVCVFEPLPLEFNTKVITSKGNLINDSKFEPLKSKIEEMSQEMVHSMKKPIDL